jgi:hypothetical protein
MTNTSHVVGDAAELEAAKAEIDRLRNLCSEVYQVAGALGADERVLDNLWAAADGKPLPHESLLPYPSLPLEHKG